MHPFRFAATMPPPTLPLADWQRALCDLEALGITTVVAADHFTDGYTFEPMVALTAAASCTTTLRLQTGVLGNDYRHPVLVHRMAAVLDVVSEGRLILGLGAGWMTSDYEAAGIALDPPGVRVDRFEEALAVVAGLFGEAPFDFDGTHYRIRALDGLPKPVQRPHPPLFVGGGSPRVLRHRRAPRRHRRDQRQPARRCARRARHQRSLGGAGLGEDRLGARRRAPAAGRDPDTLELEMNHWLAKVTPSAAAATDLLERVATRNGVDPALLAASPSVLVGTANQIVDTLRVRRDQLGISYLQLDAGFPTPDLHAFAPVIAELDGYLMEPRP